MRVPAWQLAELFDVSEVTIRQWAARGRIKRYRDGYCPKEVGAYLAKRSPADRARAACHLTSAHKTVTFSA